MLHVGDYIYEYGNGADRYGPASLAGVRDSQPPTETIDLTGYRLRHALHKADPDCRAAHRQHPWITIFDDHEVANNAWAAGAGNHQGSEGDYVARREQAMQAYLEWMPFRLPDQSQSTPHRGTRFFRRFTFGDLGDLSMVETRQNRSLQVTVPGVPFDGFVPVGLNPAIDGALAHPGRHLPEPEQARLDQGRPHDEAALALPGQPGHGLARPLSRRGPRRPRLHLRQRRPVGRLHRRPHHPPHPRGSPAQRRHGRRRRAHRRHPRVLRLRPAGDVGAGQPGLHVRRRRVRLPERDERRLRRGSRRHSAGSPANHPRSWSAPPVRPSAPRSRLNPWLRYIDGISHGFVVLDVTPERVQADYHHTPVPTSARPDPRTVPTVVPTYARRLPDSRGQPSSHARERSGRSALGPPPGRLGQREDEAGGGPGSLPPAPRRTSRPTQALVCR